jgi:membrane protease YdiL (CAAX protease family)
MEIKKDTLFKWIIAGLIGVILFLFFYERVFPPVSLSVKIDKQKALNISTEFIKKQGYELKNYKRALIFNEDSFTSYFLQRIKKLSQAREILKEDFPLWYWWIRFFKPLQKEEFQVAINPENGKILSYGHLIPEDKPAPEISKEKAEEVAKQYLINQNINPSQYELLGYQEIKQPKRKDHKFSWGLIPKGFKNAKFKFEVGIQGNKIGSFDIDIKPPEKFERFFKKESSLSQLLQLASFILTFLLIIICFIEAIKLSKSLELQWKKAFILGIFVFLIFILNYINQIGNFWIGYDTSLPPSTYIITTISIFIIGAVITSLLIILFSAVGTGISKTTWDEEKLIFMRNFSYLKTKNFGKKALLGYCVGLVILGYLVIFYTIAKQYFKIWIPLSPYYSNAISTPLPFIVPIAIGIQAAISEEFIYRIFAISLFKKIFKNIYIAVIFSALIWGLGHSTISIYPVYMRAIEVTIIGIILGIVFLKYGLEVTIFAHLGIDVILIATPLIKSGIFNAQVSGLIAIVFLLLPLLTLLKK